ncbi:MAG: transposase, partial [Verrucomicrobia bacterium]|nr:transposase [Verrucomicrobiota bacterium]
MSQRRKYTKEFKDNAVSLVLSGRAAIEVAHDLGI